MSCITQRVVCKQCGNPHTLPPGYPGDWCDCQRCGHTWKDEGVPMFDGLTAEEYAATLGDPRTTGGCALYNLSSEHQVRDEAFWEDLICGIEECFKHVETEDERHTLQSFEKWAREQAKYPERP